MNMFHISTAPSIAISITASCSAGSRYTFASASYTNSTGHIIVSSTLSHVSSTPPYLYTSPCCLYHTYKKCNGTFAAFASNRSNGRTQTSQPRAHRRRTCTIRPKWCPVSNFTAMSMDGPTVQFDTLTSKTGGLSRFAYRNPMSFATFSRPELQYQAHMVCLCSVPTP